MTNHNIVFIGLDTHKESTEVAYSLDQRVSKAIHLGKINTTKQAFIKLARQLQSKHPKTTLHFVYEAGPAVTGCIGCSLSWGIVAISLRLP